MDINKRLKELTEVHKQKNEIPSGNIMLNGLEQFTPEGILKRSMISIYGDVDSGKSRLALDLIKKNPDKLFIYVDTHNSNSKTLDNMYLLKSNKVSEINSALESMSDIDVIIIDTINNIVSQEEDSGSFSQSIVYNQILNDFLINLHTFAFRNNIIVIVINEANNYNGEITPRGPMNLRYLSSLIIKCGVNKMDTDKNNNITALHLSLNSEKNIYSKNEIVDYKIDY